MKRKALREANAAKISNSKRAIQQSCRVQPQAPTQQPPRPLEQPPPPPERRNEAPGLARTGSQQPKRGQFAAANSVPNVSGILFLPVQPQGTQQVPLL
ncbi:heart- and neural crest derivatives-expressed protein 2-like protein [Corchorus capsularis]|uniref:Heart-and neural crest derivatives-expressed protein 2-like protein n=1 Tax=Corchorus capsularis TaxID=210143 RepID=A0A1R3IFF3_COCAP|nr:heart- and neural crest derivatives-expressed protein 2-like protein [Corchorus capsularis]